MALRTLPVAAAALLLAAAPALAHVGHGPADGFAHGFLHPLGGLDHLLAMLAVGFLAAQQGGALRLALPMAFVVVMAAGGLLGAFVLPGAAIEYGIALSVVGLGALIALAVRMPVAAGALVVGAFGLLHGVAHGQEMPLGAAPFAYGAGFVLATALLHAIGLALGFALRRGAASRLAGAGVAAAGLVLLAAV